MQGTVRGLLDPLLGAINSRRVLSVVLGQACQLTDGCTMNDQHAQLHLCICMTKLPNSKLHLNSITTGGGALILRVVKCQHAMIV